jgi:hypothetical protein
MVTCAIIFIALFSVPVACCCTCLNRFNTNDTDEGVIENVDTDNDKDDNFEPLRNDEEDSVK